MSWLALAGNWALAELRSSADPASGPSSVSCLVEAKEAFAVCFGLGEELLERKRILYGLIFLAGFLSGAVVSPAASLLVSLRTWGQSSLGLACRRRADPATQAISAQGGWVPLDAPSALLVKDGTHRRSRFAAARKI